MSLIAYGLIALAVLGALGGIGYKIRESGADSVRVEWAAANAAAQKQADDERARVDALRQAQDKQATRRLADARKRTSEVVASLNQQIQAAKLPPDCRIDGVLLSTVNRALAGEGISPGTVPGKPGPAAPTR